MKERLCCMLMGGFLCAALPAWAAFDVNGDGQEGLIETIHSLQVAAGATVAVQSKIIWVSSEGTDLENGTALLNALSNITDASETNPYVIKLEPGIYNLGSDSSLYMKEYVDIEGSGQNTTKILSTRSDVGFGTCVTVFGKDNAEIRFLSIENSGDGVCSVAMYILQANTSLLNVTLLASGNGINYGLYNQNAEAPRLVNVLISASGGTTAGAINNVDSSPSLENVRLYASYGTDNNYGIKNTTRCYPEMHNATVVVLGGGSYNYGILDSYSGSFSTVRDSQITVGGGFVSDGQGGLVFQNSNMSWGVRNIQGGLTKVYNSTIEVKQSGFDGVGIYSNDAAPEIVDTTIKVSGTGSMYGVSILNSEDFDGMVSIFNSQISASGGSSNVGVSMSINADCLIQNSAISGETNSVNGQQCKIASSMLDGAANALVCAGAYDGSLAELDATCQ